MRQLTAILALILLLPPILRADDVTFGPGMESRHLGGLMIVRQGGQTTFSLGGILFSRHVKTKTLTPDGPVVTRFKLPSALHSPTAIPFLESAPATIFVDIPDQVGLLYLDGELLPTNGVSRQLESPPLRPGMDYPLKLRGVFAAGDNLLIEDKTLLLRAGESVRVSFDGSRAVVVSLRKDAPSPSGK